MYIGLPVHAGRFAFFAGFGCQCPAVDQQRLIYTVSQGDFCKDRQPCGKVLMDPVFFRHGMLQHQFPFYEN